MKTQKERILDYINEFGSISAFEAFADLGITQLSARLCELAKDGYVFSKDQETAKNRYGETIYYTRYSIFEGR